MKISDFLGEREIQVHKPSQKSYKWDPPPDPQAAVKAKKLEIEAHKKYLARRAVVKNSVSSYLVTVAISFLLRALFLGSRSTSLRTEEEV